MTTFAPYLIAKRRAGDPAVLAQEVDSAEYTFIASAINIAMSMLSTTTAKDAMSRLAFKADSSMTGVPKRYNGQITHQVMCDVDAFLQHLKHSFPMVIIDEQMHSAVLGYHPRGEWDGNFDPCTQGILVNGNRVRDMIQTSDDIPNLYAFQFLFANTFVHEIGGHLLITFLYNGRPVTPEGISYSSWFGQPQPGHSQPPGETGRHLEGLLFGGTVEYFRDENNSSDKQAGLAYLVDGSLRAGRISQTSITAVIDYQFSFPYGTTGPACDVRALRPMSQHAAGFISGSPSDRYCIAAARSKPAKFAITFSQLRHVPTHPTVRAQPIGA